MTVDFASPPGGGAQLFVGDVARAAAEDVRPLLRVPQDAQRHGAGPDPARQVARPLLRRDQPARPRQVRHAARHLVPPPDGRTGAFCHQN